MARSFPTSLVVLTLVVGGGATALAAGRGAPDTAQPTVDGLVDEVVANPTEAAIRSLRSMGQEGLDALLDYDETVETVPDATIDAVAGQRDARSSGLFWHMDLASAQDEAARTGKPIVSLRMLGDLRDERSCANSRFFRAVLYPDPRVQEALSEVVLHWSSERDVPQIRIDLGDGRVIEQTVGGNSVHYVLDSEGRVLDALPGLVDGDTFARGIRAASGLRDALEGMDARTRAKELAQWHASARDQRLNGIRLKGPLPVGQLRDAVLSRSLFPDTDVIDASFALPIAVGKGVVEQPFVPAPSGALFDGLQPDDLVVSRPALISEPTRQIILDESRSRGEQRVERFTKVLARDAAWNEMVLHTRVHDWLATTPDMAWSDLNERVYTELFGTPASDAWLGLYDPATFTGLPNGGTRFEHTDW